MCSLMDVNLIDINKHFKELQSQLSDALWEGELIKAKHLRKEIDETLIKINKGELYVPKFWVRVKDLKGS